MNRVVINLEALRDNLRVLARWMGEYGARWSVVTKALSGHEEILRALHAMGVRSVADTRVANLETIGRCMPGAERWMIRPPHLSVVDEVVRHADVSQVTEVVTMQALDRAAKEQGKRHRVVLMLELGDLREGIVLGQLNEVFEAALALEHIEVVGIGSQMGCLSGAAPNPDQVAQLLQVQELLQLKHGCALELLSAGSTVFLHMLSQGTLPPGVNHFRNGEALYLGTDLVTGGQLPELRDDVVVLEAEVNEIKKKSMVALGDTSAHTPFAKLEAEPGAELAPDARGYRALISVGQLDTEVSGLTPLDPELALVGASSDISVVNVGEHHRGLDVGHLIKFKTNYSAFVRLMSARYIPVVVEPSLESFITSISDAARSEVPPALG